MKPETRSHSLSEKIFGFFLMFTALVVLVIGWVFIVFFHRNKNG